MDAFVWLEYVTLVALLAFIIFAEVIALEVLASESAAGWQHWVVRLGIWLQLLWVFSSGQYLISEARADEPTAKGE